MRALVRLVRPAFPDFEDEDAAFRDIARSVSASRDAAVTVATLDRLLAGGPAYPDLARFRSELAAAIPPAPDLAPAAEALVGALERVPLWTLRETGWDAIAPGLRQVYRKARRRRSAEGDAGLHAWRKPVKYHLYHLRLLSGICADGMAERERAADALGEALGERQDLAMLGARLRDAAVPKGPRHALQRRIEAAQAAAEACAHELAPRVLAEKPGALVARFGAAWAAWRG